MTQGMELFTLQNTDKVSVDINVSKYDYAKVKEGQTADITIGDKKYTGKVTKISHIATTNEKGSTLIAATVSIDKPDKDIFLGVDAKVKIYAEKAEDVVTLPAGVVNIGKDGSFCYVLKDGVITKQDITTGISSEDFVEITDGIRAGDEVIEDLGSLEEGMTAEAAPADVDSAAETGRLPMSNIYEYIKMAIHNIMANKGRSFLTMLGIIIGIASVIAIVSIGEGTKNQMNSEINDIGGGQIAVYCSDDATADNVWIQPEDIDAVRELDGVEGVNVSDSYIGETVTGKGDFNLTVTGEAQDAKLVDNASMKYGSYFGQKEVEEGKNVCVISDADAKRLFERTM